MTAVSVVLWQFSLKFLLWGYLTKLCLYILAIESRYSTKQLAGAPSKSGAILAFSFSIPPSPLAKVQLSNIFVFPLWGPFNQSLLNIGPIAYSACNTVIHNWFTFRLHFYHKVHYFFNNITNVTNSKLNIFLLSLNHFRIKQLFVSLLNGRQLYRF